MLKENMSKKVRNVLSVAAISAAIVPFAVNAAATEVTAPSTITDCISTGDGVCTDANGFKVALTSTGTIDLGGKEVTADVNVDAAEGVKTTISGGKITGDITISSETVLNNVVVTGDITVADGVNFEMKGGKVGTLTYSATREKTYSIDNVEVTTLTANSAKLKGSLVIKTATVPTVVAADEGLTIKFTKDVDLSAASLTYQKNVTYDVTNIKDDAKLIGMTVTGAAKVVGLKNDLVIHEDKATGAKKVGCVYDLADIAKKLKDTVGVDPKTATQTEFDNKVDSLENLNSSAKAALKELAAFVKADDEFVATAANKNKYDTDLVVVGYVATGKIDDANKEAEKNKPAENNNQPTNVADVKSEDNVAVKNPKTADSILSYVGLAISSLAGLGVAAKKYLFK